MRCIIRPSYHLMHSAHCYDVRSMQNWCFFFLFVGCVYATVVMSYNKLYEIKKLKTKKKPKQTNIILVYV